MADKYRTINRKVITTPDGVKIYDLKVEVGKTDLRNPNQGHTYMVREGDIVIHPSYGTGAALGSTRVYDVAVVKLSTPGNTPPPKWHGLPPQPIKLATAGEDYMEEPGPGRVATTLGWGATTSAGTRPSDVLKWAQVPLVSDAAAKKIYGKKYLPDFLVAAGGLPGTGACKGDSGGVLFSGDAQQTPYQIGVTQGNAHKEGGPLCPTGDPDVYAEVNEPRIRGFIEKHIAEIPGTNGW